jgi:DNA polymerase III delta subunit
MHAEKRARFFFREQRICFYLRRCFNGYNPRMPKPTQKPALSAVIILAGEELYLRNQHLAEIQRDLFQGEDPGMGLVRLDAAALGGEAMAVVLDEVRTPSMFAPKKLVIVDPADPLLKKADADLPDGRLTNREILEHYVEAPAEASTLVLVFNTWLKTTRLHKALDKVGAIRSAEPIKEFQVPAWIIKRAKEGYDKNIEPAATELLADLIGPDLQRLDNELAKLSLYEPNAPAITRKAVDALVGFQHEQQIWDMINALASRDAPAALKKIDELWSLDPKIEYTATGAIFSWLNQVLKARELADRRMADAAIGKELKLWPLERAQKVLTLARSWGLEGAARWSEAILKMDLANKSSLGEPRRNLEKFVVELCTA